jgi:hypothetical protein
MPSLLLTLPLPLPLPAPAPPLLQLTTMLRTTAKITTLPSSVQSSLQRIGWHRWQLGQRLLSVQTAPGVAGSASEGRSGDELPALTALSSALAALEAAVAVIGRLHSDATDSNLQLPGSEQHAAALSALPQPPAIRYAPAVAMSASDEQVGSSVVRSGLRSAVEASLLKPTSQQPSLHKHHPRPLLHQLCVLPRRLVPLDDILGALHLAFTARASDGHGGKAASTQVASGEVASRAGDPIPTTTPAALAAWLSKVAALSL